MDQLEQVLLRKGFHKLLVNANHISVFHRIGEQRDYVILLFSMLSGNEWSKDQCFHVEEQLKSKLKRQGQELELIPFIITKQPKKISSIYRDFNHFGMIDLHEYRLLLFEGMPRDELGIYQEIEALLGIQRAEVKQELPVYSPNKSAISSFFYKVKSIGLVTLLLILMNALIFFISEFSNERMRLTQWGSLFWYPIKEKQEYYRLFTSMFLHSDFEHLAYNMLTLGVIGNTVEKLIGRFRFFAAYMITGFVAGLVSMSYNMEKGQFVQSIGASGAIFGVIGVLFWIVLIHKGRVENFSKRQMVLFVALSLYGGFSNQGIDNVAHVSGLIAGFILALLFYRVKWSKSATQHFNRK